MSETIDQLLAQAKTARREDRLDDARRDLLDAVILARAGSDRADLARAVTELGRIERDMLNREEACGYYGEAARMYRDQGDMLKCAHSIRHCGDIFAERCRMDDAERCYHEAVAMYRADPHAPPLDVANALRPLALLKHDAGKSDEADPLWQEAKSLYASVNVLPGVAECAARQALLARRAENVERARQMLAEATAAAEASGEYNSIRYVNEVKTWIAG
jgi:tetratricopeptide (TPR) repeat protein